MLIFGLQIGHLVLLQKMIGQGFDYLFKLVVIGDSGVGKTNLLSRFQKNEFTHESKATIGVEFATKTVNLQNNRIKTQIWDTAGQQRYRAITHAYYKGASGALMVFDLTKRSSYESIPKWIKQLKDNSQQNMVCILIGNKCDRQEERAVRLDEAIEFSNQNHLHYLQTSALTGNNVENAFMNVIGQIYTHVKGKGRHSEPVQKKQNQIMIAKKVLQENKRPENKKCCG